jgi:bifunctional non-homologous end joining protein LigD
MYSYELKYDGYRMLVLRGRDGVRFMSRSRQDWTDSFPAAVDAIAALPVHDAVLDGEVCVLDERGVPRFQQMQRHAQTPKNVIFVAFDLLWLNGTDLRALPIEQRREGLAMLLRESPSRTITLSSAVDGDPAMLLELARQHGLEGIVAKRKGSRYVGGRTRDWIKLKCTRRQEFAVFGYKALVGTRSVGALLLALRDADGLFVYAGRVGTGFDDATRRELAAFLDGHAVTEPFARGVPAELRRVSRWTKPSLVVDVEFLEWSDDGSIRNPSFRGVRIDKTPEDCVRED